MESWVRHYDFLRNKKTGQKKCLMQIILPFLFLLVFVHQFSIKTLNQCLPASALTSHIRLRQFVPNAKKPGLFPIHGVGWGRWRGWEIGVMV